MRANSSTARHLDSYLEEVIEGSASVRQAASLTNLDDKPLIVLTADTGHDAEWQSAQDQLVALSSNSLHRVATPPTGLWSTTKPMLAPPFKPFTT